MVNFEEPPKNKEFERQPANYEKDFGHTGEEMLCEVLMKIDCFKNVDMASVYDDEENRGKNIDVIITDIDGNITTAQVSMSGSDKERTLKIDQLKDHPYLTELHDDQGQITKKGIFPRCIIGYDLIKYGEAYNKALSQGSSEKSSFLPDLQQEKKNILKKMIKSLEFAKGYGRNNEQHFDARIKLLNQALAQL